MICRKCALDKPAEDFQKSRRVCKRCQADYTKARNHASGKSKTYNGQPRQDLVGKQFGKLIVLRNDGMQVIGNGRCKGIFWLCQCACGVQKSISHTHLVRKVSSVKSCGCGMTHPPGPSHPSWMGHGEISGNRWNGIKRERPGRKKVVPFDITIEEAWILFLQQDRKCALSGIELYFGETGKSKFTASLDRIDSSKGYTVGNVQWVHTDINWMKNVFDNAHFIEMCRKVASTHPTS